MNIDIPFGLPAWVAGSFLLWAGIAAYLQAWQDYRSLRSGAEDTWWKKALTLFGLAADIVGGTFCLALAAVITS